MERYDNDKQRANAFAGFTRMERILESYGHQVAGYDEKRKAHYDQMTRLIERGSLREAAEQSDEFGLREAVATGDLPVLLGGYVDLQVRESFGAIDQPWRAFAKVTNIPNFREQKLWYPIDLTNDTSGKLPVVPEGQGYDEADLSEYYERGSIATYGEYFTITRQALINDDKRALQAIPQGLGRAAARTINHLVADVMTVNASATVCGPAMVDTYNLFEVSTSGAHHGNMSHGAFGLGSADDFSVVEAEIVKFGKQKVPGGNGITLNELGIKPRYIIVPSTLELQVQKLISQAQRIISSGTTAATVVATSANVLAFLQPVVLPELASHSETNWYLAADANQAPTIEVGFLNGKETPDLFVRNSDLMTGSLAEADGVQHKIRMDVGAYPAGWSFMRYVSVSG